MTTARAQLLAEGRVRLSAHPTRTGIPLPLLHPGDDRGIKDRIRTAARHKRALHSRFEIWARSTSRHPQGLLGTAGERVVRRSLRAAAATGSGIRPVQPGDGEVNELLGQRLEGGALDSAAWVDAYDEYGRAVGGSVLCPIEVKNVRHWIYPNAAELYQVLYKAARLQQRHPDQEICPTLFVRRCDFTTDQAMSRDLGFRILEMRRQFVLPVVEVRPEEVREMHDALAYTDLERHDQEYPTIVGLLRGTLARSAKRNAQRWMITAPELVDYFDALRRDTMRPHERDASLAELREAVAALPATGGGW